MNLKPSWHRAAVLALATATLLSLTACAPSAPASAPNAAAASSSSTKEAGVLTKDLQVCFENTSSAAVTLEWISGVSTNSGSGTLQGGQSLCGEGPQPKVAITFSESFTANMEAFNPAIGQPKVAFTSVAEHTIESCGELGCLTGPEPDVAYADARYAEGESVGSDIEGHLVSVTRNANNDWVNFTVTILD